MAFSYGAKAEEGAPRGHDLLKENYKVQRYFLQISMSMAGAIASQSRPDIAKCIGEWYPVSAEIREDRHQEMVELIKQYPEYNPTAVVLATIQKYCGKFKDAQG